MREEDQKNSEQYNQKHNQEPIETKFPDNESLSGGEIKKTTKKAKSDQGNLAMVLDYPNRTLPKIIDELIDSGLTVIASKTGYYVEGFYGMNPDILGGGYIFAQDTSVPNMLVFFDVKNTKHYIKTIKELAFLNSTIWGAFLKTTDKFSLPNQKWMPILLQHGALNISPK